MKTLGAVLILLSGTLAGLCRAAELSRRVFLLAALRRTLAGFETELCGAARPLEEAVARMGDSPFCRAAAGEPAFPRDPRAALLRVGERLLRGGDLALYREFVAGLGISDSRSQRRHLALYLRLVDERLAAARAQRERLAVPAACAGAFGGLALCLILL